MKIKFNIDYHTFWGQKVMVTGSGNELGDWDLDNAISLEFMGGGTWSKEILFPVNSGSIEYKFLTYDDNHKTYELEFGENRVLSWQTNDHPAITIRDAWRSHNNDQNSLLTSPFQNGLIATVKPKNKKLNKIKKYQFNLRTLGIPDNHTIGLIGESEGLGNWDLNKVIPLQRVNQNQWSINLELNPSDIPSYYKYVLLNGEVESTRWELDGNRLLNINSLAENKENSVIMDENARFPYNDWRGAGLAIPVFSIRSKQSTGVGEFSDIKPLVDWAVKTGLKLIQILPVNDTVATNTWVDSYPYAAISVHALHPMYLNVWEAGKLNDQKKIAHFKKRKEELNSLSTMDYEQVMQLKSEYTHELYEAEGLKVLSTKEFESFYQKNTEWLPAYAMFCHLRDLNGTSDFKRWKAYQKITKKELDQYTSKKSKQYKEVGYYYFLQYNLDKQLKEATKYARKHGVVLKGDIPIGIYRNSADAWLKPEFYHMDSQAGAPPDDFSITGQNWGFPTYNWDKMSQDGYQWWQLRLQKMADYFDVFRIDHILGFFRIWEIPIHAVDGLLGHFNPSLPFSVEELKRRGIAFDYDRFCKPFVKDYLLKELFYDHVDYVKETFLNQLYGDTYEFKKEFNTQKKVKKYIEDLNSQYPENKGHHEFLKIGLFDLLVEVIFLESPESNGSAFNPRIAFQSTYSYNGLDEYTKYNLNQLYNDYFYKRHNDFWQEKALQKLPALKSATDMLICGEDLGMVPDCVPGVMDELKILSLAIQRMPNDSSKEFWHPNDTPYLSVCSTSSHDMSTLRGWWEEDTERTQRFFQNVLGHDEKAPTFCEPWVAKEVINQHLYSPSMWAIFPLQDLLAMDSKLRREDPNEERINVPANPQHYWRYRMHMNIEELLDEKEFNDNLLNIITSSGRNIKY